MKKFLTQVLAVFLLVAVCGACEPMNSNYEQYIVPGGIIYTGKASSPQVHVGRYRVQISWLRGTDPTVTKARIFWNNYSDSLEVAIPAEGHIIRVMIENLKEQTYTFIIKTYDAKGNTSVPVELLTAAYGAKFQSQLLSRPINTAVFTPQGGMKVEWGGADITGGAYATDLTYTDPAGILQKIRIPARETTTSLPPIKPGTTLQYHTIYLPAALSIDTFYTASQEHKQFQFDKSTWSIPSFSTQHNTAAENVVTNFIDGSAATRWHTLNTAKYPHFAVVDMKSEKTISAFEVFKQTGDLRGPNKFQLQVSTNNTTWQDLGTFNFDPAKEGGQLYAMPANTKGRYFKFTGLSGPQIFMVMGEINVYGF